MEIDRECKKKGKQQCGACVTFGTSHTNEVRHEGANKKYFSSMDCTKKVDDRVGRLLMKVHDKIWSEL